jgi:predicted phage terminase large subunit-like protein
VLSKEVLEKIEKNLVNFRSVILSNDEENELKPAEFHYKLSDLLLKDKENIAIEMFRESGKSSYALRTFPLHAIAYPSKKRDYIVIIKQNQRTACNKLKELINEYHTNPLLKHNLVEVKEQSQNAFSVDVKNKKGETVNVRIEAFGKGAAIRGLSNSDRRPKIIILDDIQDKEDARSETVVETDWDWFLSDVLFLGKNARLFMIGNNLGERCVIERIINNAKELNFKALRIPVIIEGVPTWSEKQSLEEIEKEKSDFAKLGKLDIWYAEKMCQAVAEDSKVFKEEDYRYYSPHSTDDLINRCNLYACLDPASSNRPDSCLRAITVVGVDADNYWFILDCIYGRWDSSDMLDIIFDTVRKYGLNTFHIEKGHYQQVLEPFMLKEQRRRNVFFNVIPLEHAKQGSKLERIKLLQPRFKAHTVYFPDKAEWLGEMKAELAGVTKDSIKSQYIDCVDALAMTEQVAVAPVNSKVSYNESFNRNRNSYVKQSLFSISGY